MKPTLRKAERKDEVEILNLVATVLGPYNLKISPDEIDKDLMDLDKFYFTNNGWFGVLTDEKNRIVGSCGVLRIDDKICELRKMYLLKEYQGQGLGKFLLDVAIERAKDLGYSEMHLESNSVLTTANRMYKKYGFEVFRPDHLSWRCDYAMRKRLD